MIFSIEFLKMISPFFLLSALGLVLYKFLYPFIKYPVNVLIKEKRGNAIILKKDRARRVKEKEGSEKYHLWKNNQTIEPPKFANYMINEKGKPVLELFSPTFGEFKPTLFKNPPNLTVEDKSARFWFVQEHKRIRERYYKPSFMERYAPYIAMGLLATFGVVQLIIWSKSTGFMSSNLAQAARSFESSAKAIAKAMTNLPLDRPPIG